MQQQQKVKLNKNLWAAPGGVAIIANAGAHSEIKLHPHLDAVQFPIKTGTMGTVVEVLDKQFVVRLTQKENLNDLKSVQQVDFIVTKSAFGFFFSTEN